MQASYDLIRGEGTCWVDATIGAQLTSIADYEEERAARGSADPNTLAVTAP